MIIGLGLLGLIFGLLIYLRKKLAREAEEEFRLFLTSDKYKVKGQYD